MVYLVKQKIVPGSASHLVVVVFTVLSEGWYI